MELTCFPVEETDLAVVHGPYPLVGFRNAPHGITKHTAIISAEYFRSPALHIITNDACAFFDSPEYAVFIYQPAPADKWNFFTGKDICFYIMTNLLCYRVHDVYFPGFVFYPQIILAIPANPDDQVGSRRS